ncbi:peritrophin-1-like [Penaeus japonicus]|uniref:peritrophin-1-like n=1 Tax=Penaeus japonicus TaxID=27405 RepID=UPI001C713001|nr:peritrophin-1-like [Penaeus japonicus]
MTMKFLRFALLVILKVSLSEQVCAPDCSGVDPGVNVRDPTDYTKYYICLDVDGSGNLLPSSESVPCPPGKFFNDGHTLPKCDPIEDMPDVVVRTTCDPCKPHCPEGGIVTPHPTDCSRYYVCLNDGHTVEYECATGYYFDYIAGVCSEDRTHCYEYCDPCQPHCTHVYQRVPDPYNCTKFYLCTVGGVVSFKCPYGKVFNEELHLCQTGINCINNCISSDPKGKWV